MIAGLLASSKVRCAMRRLTGLGLFMIWGCQGGTSAPAVRDGFFEQTDVLYEAVVEARMNDSGPLDNGLSEFLSDALEASQNELDGTSVLDDGIEEEKVLRRFTFRAIGGISMGANAVTIAAKYPDKFDVVGSMGGYVDYRYLAHMMTYFFLGGFCPRKTILANLEHINDPSWPGVFCGPVKPTMPWEWNDWSFNHFHYDDSGFKSDRDFLFEVMGGFMMAFGNLLYYNPNHPLLPPGVSENWFKYEPNPCENPVFVGKPYNYNAEYNPDGEYLLVTFCDGETVQCDTSDPECRAKKGSYEPDKPHKRPIWFMLAVDYNSNGRRDYGEPVVVNAFERFKDVGSDGCPDPYEDGNGGCLGEPRNDGAQDPNGDNYDLMKNPAGTEGNFEYDEGEPFEDFGLDGVPNTGDFGEGNGQYDINPRFKKVLEENDARTIFRTAPLEVISRLSWWFDGGIRDALHAVPCTMQQWNALKIRGLDVRDYDDFGSTANSIVPGVACDDLISVIPTMDLSSSGIGRNVMLRYGDPNANEALIKQGSGKHVGLPCEIVARAILFYTLAAFRMPDPIVVADGDTVGRIVNSSFYSHALQNRVRYSISLPPGYDLPENASTRYPLLIFLPGHGMAAKDMVQTGLIFNALMGLGSIPRFILLAPEGQCCYFHKQTGKRMCGCTDAQTGPGMDCIDPDCIGPHESCEVMKNVPMSDLVQECPSGHFFVNHVTNRFGDPKASEVMRFEDALVELLDVVDSEYRTRPAEEVLVPVGL